MKEKSKATKAEQALLDRIHELEHSNSLLNQKVIVVGVRWYGHGAMYIKFGNEVAGVRDVLLKGYGDKAVIDYTTWVRLKKDSPCVTQGILVRDDTVVAEDAFTDGNIGIPDKDTNVNSYNDDEIISIIEKEKISKFKERISEFTAYPGPSHFLDVIKNNELDCIEKKVLLQHRHRELFTAFRWAKIHPRELIFSCVNYGIDSAGLTDVQMREALTKIELELTSTEWQ